MSFPNGAANRRQPAVAGNWEKMPASSRRLASRLLAGQLPSVAEPFFRRCTAAAAAEPEDVAFPLRFNCTAACVRGWSIAVHLARQLVVIGGQDDYKLHCYNLGDGVEVGVVGRGPGDGHLQFMWHRGGICVTPRGTLLVADNFNNRMPEVDLDVRDSFARVFGQSNGAPTIDGPQYVDCNGVHVAVSEWGSNRVSVLS